MGRKTAEATTCVWCQSAPGTTDDHVFPHFVGGTKGMAVSSCRPCQDAIGDAESHVAKRSELALHRVQTEGARPRKPERADSGVVHAPLLSKHPDGSLHQTVFQVGKLPRGAPALEVDLRHGTMTFMAMEGMRELKAAIWDHQRKLDRVPVEILQHDRALSEPGFRPRIYLAGGKLRMLVRSHDEAERLVKHLRLNMNKIQRGRPGNKTTTRLEAGTTPIYAQLSYDEQSLIRVVAKIGAGTLFVGLPSLASWSGFEQVRHYIIGRESTFDGASVVVEFQVTGRSPWPSEHVALVRRDLDGVVRALVVLYSAAFVFDVGPAPDDFRGTVVARCAHANGSTRLCGPEEADATNVELVSALEATLGVQVT